MAFHSFTFLPVFLFSFFFFWIAAQPQGCNPNDLTALQDFMRNLKQKPDGWDFNSSTDCCKWVGITCNSSISLGLVNDPNLTFRVTRLELVRTRLNGKLSDSLGRLDQLRTLNLSHNLIKSHLPLSLFTLPNLQALDLSHNDFYGPIPQNITLPSLKVLDLSFNSLNGSVPTDICNVSNTITMIRLAVNYLSGDLPFGLGRCKNSLVHLCLGMNDLTGQIPNDIFELKNLNLLGLQDNKFSGYLSTGIGNLSSLERLDVSSNTFVGELPDVFHKMSSFKYLVAHSNSFSGEIPASLSNSGMISLLNLRNNSLSGVIRLNCTAMTGLASLDLGSNHFNGSLPENLPSCKRLKNINLARNSFGGQLPVSFGKFDSVSYLSLTRCGIVNLSSTLQILQQCKNLTTLVLTNNFQSEALPDDSNLYFEKLKVLVMANCNLHGSVPQWLSRSKNLQLLDLSWNRLAGNIPNWIGNYTDMFYLDLSNNSFTGEIPKSLTSLPSLINRTINLEEPSPDFPFFMKRNNTLRALQYNQVWSFPPTLDVSNNHLSGPIWPEFGDLRKLHVIELQRNHLSGSIPNNLSGMISLETLDLSHNNLSGTIPTSLVRLTFLSKFSVASNNLSGIIPSGGQFPTFPNSSFEGNDLCGEHRFPCRGSVVPRRAVKISNRGRDIVIGTSVGIVFGTACVLGLLFMIILRAHRREEVVDHEKEDDSGKREELGSDSVFFFQHKENSEDVSMDDLLKSTDNFNQSNIIGCGGFGLVYKAVLPNGQEVAIKRLSSDCGQADREFQAEVQTLSRAQHTNLVLLQGYCLYKNARLLIYSFMENGSLDYWLHEKTDGPAALDWHTRLKIAQGSASGLAYLHQSCEPHILHRDIKSSNILLDRNFVAHLADFGLARDIHPYDTHVSTDLVGTLGYIPPEYGQAAVATYKGDIYSFGVVLLELLTGKRPLDMCKPKGSRDLISWVIRMKMENRESEVFDPCIYKKEHAKEMSSLLDMARLCLSENPKARPTTNQLVACLDSLQNKP